MFIVGLVGWWYGSGWKKVGVILMQKAVTSEDYFSIDLLFKTLFAPFRQISADGSRGGTLGDKMRAAFDKLFSRVIGAVIRLILVLVGCLWLLINFVIDLIIMLAWPLLPILPVIGLVFTLTGWVPWKR
jgi:hypothetical protein